MVATLGKLEQLYLRNLQQSIINFRWWLINLDQKQPGFPEHVLQLSLKRLGVEYTRLLKRTLRYREEDSE